MRTPTSYYRSGKLILILILITAVLATDAWADTNIRVTKPSRVEFLDTMEAIDLAPGVPLKIAEGRPLRILPEGQVPIILYPVASGTKEIEISSLPVKTILANGGGPELNELVSSILGEVANIQDLIRRQKLTEATELFTRVQNKYSGVSYLGFLHASLLLLDGRRDEARKAAELALKHNPDSVEGKQFLEALGGKR